MPDPHGYRDRDTENWLNDTGAASVLSQQLPLLAGRPDLVTTTMGSNDLLGAFGNAGQQRPAIREVAARGEEILRRVHAAAGGRARVLLTTVYDPSDGTGAVPGGLR